MKARKDWSRREWIARYICVLTALAALVGAVYLFRNESFAEVPLLLGVVMIVLAGSWAPELLLAPKLPKGQSFLEAVEIPRIASFLLAHGVYWLVAGIVVLYFARLR